MNPNLVLRKLFEAGRNFGGNSEYQKILDEANYLFKSSDYEGCEKELAKLPTANQLLEKLINKLKGKSVYCNLIKSEGKKDLVALKSLSSLLTHTIIEWEQGNKEFQMLIPVLLEHLNDMSYELMK